MIEVKSAYSMAGIAKEMYERFPNTSVLKVTIEEGASRISHEMSVAEAEQLAADLMEWVHEFKPREDEEE